MEKLNKKVLIIEDELSFLGLLRDTFSAEGFDVIYAPDGEDGLALAKKEKPDILILDILMPKMDGIEVAKKLKEAGIMSPIIFLTNLKDADHIANAMESARSDSDYIIKSDINIEDLIERAKTKLGIVK